jgi:hypothetical protein
MSTLQSSVNIKANKYKLHTDKIYLVSANNSITQESLDNFVLSMNIPFHSNISPTSLDYFLRAIKKKAVYPNPLL